MTFTVIAHDSGYIGEVSAPNLQAAIEFLEAEGFPRDSYTIVEDEE